MWTRPGLRHYKIVEGEYETGAQEQLYIENNGVIAIANESEGLTVWGSMQCPYYVHKALVKLFELTEDKIRVIQTETGGGFGGKEEYPSMIAGHAGLLALEIRQARENHLRSRRGYVGHHQATSIADPSQNRCDQRRETTGDGDRVRRRRRALTAHFRRSCFRVERYMPPAHIIVPTFVFAERSGHESAATRSVSRFRRTAEHIRPRAPHGPGSQSAAADP